MIFHHRLASSFLLSEVYKCVITSCWCCGYITVFMASCNSVTGSSCPSTFGFMVVSRLWWLNQLIKGAVYNSGKDCWYQTVSPSVLLQKLHIAKATLSKSPPSLSPPITFHLLCDWLEYSPRHDLHLHVYRAGADFFSISSFSAHKQSGHLHHYVEKSFF